MKFAVSSEGYRVDKAALDRHLRKLMVKFAALNANFLVGAKKRGNYSFNSRTNHSGQLRTRIHLSRDSQKRAIVHMMF